MMTKILSLGLIIASTVYAEAPSEEAIILNQELQFLEESANDVTIISQKSENPTVQNSLNETESLEKQYFGNELQDGVSSKAAAPKRRRSEIQN
jgi:hypothetical protein